jgi:hypothetical protein
MLPHHLSSSRSKKVHPCFAAQAVLAACVALTFTWMGIAQESAPKSPYEVKIQDEKAVEPISTLDPTNHVQLRVIGNMYLQIQADNQFLHQGYLQTLFQMDGQITFPGNFPSRMISTNRPLPRSKGKKDRSGFVSVCQIGNVTITQEVEVVPSKAKDGKRRRDSAMVRYLVENKDSHPHKVGIRIVMNPFLGRAQGNLFAAPNQPNKILDGVELKDKMVPNYLQVLQRPNLKNPGAVAYMTYNFGRAFDRPDRVVLTGQRGAFVNAWEMRVIKSMGFTTMGFYWDPKEIKAGGKRHLAYAFGNGIAQSPEGDGLVAMVFGGSFEPGKMFTLTAYVQDPAPGQTLTLELPKGMQRIEGKERQPVPEVDEDGNAMVLWKGRVQSTGRFPLRIHSSTGATQTKIITVSKAK